MRKQGDESSRLASGFKISFDSTSPRGVLLYLDTDMTWHDMFKHGVCISVRLRPKGWCVYVYSDTTLDKIIKLDNFIKDKKIK